MQASAEVSMNFCTIQIDRNALGCTALPWDAGIVDEQDERSLAIHGLDLSCVRLEHQMGGNEHYLSGEENLNRLKVLDMTRLDIKILDTLWTKPDLIPERFKAAPGEPVKFVYFDGTIVRDATNQRLAHYLCWSRGAWDRGYNYLTNYRDAYDLSAIVMGTRI